MAAFIQNGILQDLPPQYVPPLEPSDVKMMLTELYKETEDGTITSLIVRPTVLQIPEYLSIYATSQTGLHLYTTNSFFLVLIPVISIFPISPYARFSLTFLQDYLAALWFIRRKKPSVY